MANWKASPCSGLMQAALSTTATGYHRQGQWSAAVGCKLTKLWCPPVSRGWVFVCSLSHISPLMMGVREHQQEWQPDGHGVWKFPSPWLDEYGG
ncbi:hypothetical protein BRADI_1g78801v3 [Brachypodium distachyon]|uniref:Uncharacterized protein n=1 Tax=Brachypodium distachyon TaxID=15368 RepID=A0A2K2DVU9_BRADI|nr:hypothetical protein BRADI_1g78801v3 [Brachypodium distachyon]